MDMTNQEEQAKPRLKSKELLDAYSGDKSLYRIAKDGCVNYTTLHRWLDKPEDVQGISLDVLYGFLIGLGLSAESIRAMPLGDIVEF
jgi:hypothetical protein